MSEMIRDQAQNLRELMRKPKELKFITVASGKGGVGKSSISVNLAIALRTLGIRVLVMDADFGLANVDVLLGVTSRYNVSHFLRGEKTLSEIIQYGYDGVRFISGGSGVYELLNMDETQLQELLQGLVWLNSPVDYIICDMGAGINDTLLQMILASTETIVVTSPEPTAILDAYALVKTIVLRNDAHPIHVIMNKCENKNEAGRVLQGFCEIVRKHLGKQLHTLGYIRYDHNVLESVKRQVPIVISHPDGAAARDIKAVARALLEMPDERAQTNPLSKIFARLFG